MQNSKLFHPFFPVLIFTLSIFGLFAQAYEQCGFPNERCLCSGPSVLCRCSQVTAQNSLDLSSAYHSHLVHVAGIGCQPCPPECTKCDSLRNCEICRDEYYLQQEQALGRCLPCQINCKRCSSSPSAGRESICSKCVDGFYLDSKFECQACPLEGTLECTANELLSCLPNYFMDSNGATCISCSPDCLQCSSVTKCSQCQAGFYLSSVYKCIRCLDRQCSKCDDNVSACSHCLDPSHFYHSQRGCVSCSQSIQGCLHCTTSEECDFCAADQGFVLNPRTRQCEKTASRMPWCKQGVVGSNGPVCSECQPGYYLEQESNKCRYGCSILCEECTGAHYGLCRSCGSPKAEQAQNYELYNLHCLPSMNMGLGEKYQLYYTAMNHHNIDSIFPNSKAINRLIKPCLHESILISTRADKQLLLRLEDPRAYKITIRWKVYIITHSSSNLTYSVQYFTQAQEDPPRKQQEQVYSIKEAKCMLCTDGEFVCLEREHSIELSSHVGGSGYLLLGGSLGDGYMGVAEVLVVGDRCGGVQGAETCQECSDIRTCTRCVNPSHSILYEKCVIECPKTYYTYLLGETVKKCYEICPYGSHPVNSPDSNTCQRCPSQCTSCQSADACLSCAKGFYLVQALQKCAAECPSGFFANPKSSKCEVCIYPCQSCSSIHQCRSCLHGFHHQEDCVNFCPQGSYPDYQARECKKCAGPCAHCTYSLAYKVVPPPMRSQLGPIGCLTCQEGHILIPFRLLELEQELEGGVCSKLCPNGYTNATGNQECERCPSECQSCTSKEECSSCSNGYFLHSQRCASTCPASTFPSELAKKCSPCPSQCRECASPTQCSHCNAPNSYLSLSQVCLKHCPAGFYSEKGQGQSICMACTPPCRTCTSSSFCESCSSLFLVNGKCTGSCQEGQFGNTETLQCQSCAIQCAQCSQAKYCLACKKDYVFLMVLSVEEGLCIEECPSGMFPDAGTCSECPSSCKACTNQTFCSGCPPATILQNQTGKCAKQCPKGSYYLLALNTTASCLSCMENCDYCALSSLNSSQLVCSSCQPAHYLSSDLQQCRETGCPAGQYHLPASSRCFGCVLPCLNCLSENQCTSCMDGMGSLLLNGNGSKAGICTIQCPSGYHQASSQSRGLICERCPASCLTCSKESNTVFCLECKQNYFLTLEYRCVESCQKDSGLYGEEVTRRCLSCSSKCLQCHHLSHNCSKCAEGFFLHFSEDNTSECVSVCPDGTYLGRTGDGKGESDSCSKCPTHCEKCISEQLCYSCSESNFLFSKAEGQSVCTDKCPTLMYGNTIVGHCVPCVYPCMDCESAFLCKSCGQGLFLTPDQTCVNQCSYGTYLEVDTRNSTSPSSASCKACPETCSECLSASQCISCSKGRVLIDGSCQASCPRSMYDTGFGSCMPCIFGCSACESGSTCKECIKGFLFEGECRRFCPYGLVPIGEGETQTCARCENQCRTCSVSPGQCTSCHKDRLLYLSQCVEKCPSGHYPSAPPSSKPTNGVNRCLACTNPCQTCSNAYSCDSCMYGYILYMEKDRSQCVSSLMCPNGYYLGSVSQVCKIRCSPEEYTLESTRRCYGMGQCPIGYAHYEKGARRQCVTSCPGSPLSVAWVDHRRYCGLTEESSYQFPQMMCQFENIRNLLIARCFFNVEMSPTKLSALTPANLDITFSDQKYPEMVPDTYGHLFMTHKLQVLQIEPKGTRQISIVLSLGSTSPINQSVSSQPFRNSSHSVYGKLRDVWVNVGIRPRFLLRSEAEYQPPGPLSQGRLLQRPNNQTLLLQNSDTQAFLHLFNSYSATERQTGIFLLQLATGFSIAIMVIWLFSLVRNKEIYSSMGVTGLQWLYLLSICPSTHFPPNLQQLLEGFKSSMLILIPSATGPNSEVDSNILWTITGFRQNVFEKGQTGNRYELFDLVDLSSFNTLGAPILVFASLFLFLFLALTAAKKSLRHYLYKKIDRRMSKFSPTVQNRDTDTVKEVASDSQAPSSSHGEQQEGDEMKMKKEGDEMKMKKEGDGMKMKKEGDGMKKEALKKSLLKEHSGVIRSLKKVKIIQNRFTYNYLHQIICFLAIPIFTLLLVQVISPTPLLLGIVLSMFLVVCTVLIHARVKLYPMQQENNPQGVDEKKKNSAASSLTSISEKGEDERRLQRMKQKRGVCRYLLVTVMLQFLTCTLTVLSTDFMLCLGGMAIIFLIEVCLSRYIFEFYNGWVKSPFLILSILKLLILAILFIIHVSAENWHSSGIYWLGWIGVAFIVSYVLVASVTVARNLFEGASSTHSKSKRTLKQPIRKGRSNTNKDPYSQGYGLESGNSLRMIQFESRDEEEEDEFDLDDLMKSHKSLGYEYREEDSFFEDVDEVHGDSESEELGQSDDIIDFTEQSSLQKQDRKMPPKQILTEGLVLRRFLPQPSGSHEQG